MVRGEDERGERQSALLEIALPIVGIGVVAVLAILTGDIPLGHRANDMGWWFFAISGAAVTGIAGTATLLWLKRQGWRVPVAILLVFATLPWLAGLGGMRFGLHQAGRAIEHADWSMFGIMSLRGYSEAAACAHYGQLLSTALLGALAIVLGVRSEGERPRALIGVVVLVACIALVGPTMSIVAEPVASVMLLPVLVGAVAFGTSVGKPGAPAVAITTFLGSVAACAATKLEPCIRVFEVAPNADSQTRRSMLEDVVDSYAALELSAWIVVCAMGLATIVVVAESVRRRERAAIARAVAMACVALAVLGLQRVTQVSSMRTIEEWTSLPWRHLDDFQLARTSDQWASEPWVVVDAEGGVWMHGRERPEEPRAVLQAVEEEQHERELEHEAWLAEQPPEETPEWLEEEPMEPRGKRYRDDDPPQTATKNRYGIEPTDPDVEAAREQARWVGRFYDRPSGEIEGCAIGGGRPMTIAIDARLEASALFDVMEGTGGTGIVGRRAEAPPVGDLDALPVVANVVERDGLGELAVATTRDVCEPNAGHDVLLTTTLGTTGVEMFRDFEANEEVPFSALSDRADEDVNSRFFIFVRLEPGATVQHVADFDRALRDVLNNLRIVLVRELPRLPPPVELPIEVSDAAREVRVSIGQPWPAALADDVVRPIVEDAVTLCAQRAVTASPELWAELYARIRVARDGSVASIRTVGGSAAHRPLRTCITEALQASAFPAQRNDARFSVRLLVGDPELPIPTE